MSGVHTAAARPVAPTSSAASGSAAQAALLPEPLGLTGPGIDDALGLLYSAMSGERQQTIVTGGARVKASEANERRAIQAEKAAFDKQAENDAHHGTGFFGSLAHLVGDVTTDLVRLRPDQAVRDGAHDVSEAAKSPAFWNDLEKGALWVAKVSVVVGSVAATAATAGAGAETIAGAAALLTVGGDVVTRTKCFGKLSGEIGMGMELAGAAGGLTAALLPASSAVDSALHAVELASEGISGGATAVAGAAHVKNSEFAANVQVATADATEARHQDDQMQQLSTGVIDELKAQDKTTERTMQAAQDAIKTDDQAHATAAAGVAPIKLRG